jgi:multidrug transporter EmrE-like cation transporter
MRYYIYVFLTLFLTVYGQLVIKWQIDKAVVEAGQFPAAWLDKIAFLLRQFLNPWILSGFAAAFLAAVSWMAAMTRLQIGVAYPFMSLAFVLVLAFSIAFLGENLTWAKGIGTAMVVCGLIVMTR